MNNHLSITDRTGPMIGFLALGEKNLRPSAQTPQNQIENFINNLDFELLMETYDMLVDTSKQLKPLMKEITPFFHQFSKKFKSN